MKHLMLIGFVFAMLTSYAQKSTILPIQDSIVELYYDTILIYDTIFVEEIVYDTVVMYDTIYVEEVMEYLEWRENNNVKWFAEAFLKPEFAFPNHTGTIEYYDYIERVKASEQPLLNPTFGAAIGRRLGAKYVANCGFGYATLKKRISYEFTDSIMSATDTVFSQQTFHNSNNLFFLDIPITIGQYKSFGTSAVEFSGGVVTNVFLLSDGKTLSPESYNEVIELSDLNWRTVSFSFILEGTYLNALTKNIDFSAKVFFKYAITNVYQVSSKFEQRPNYLGLKIGFRYHF